MYRNELDGSSSFELDSNLHSQLEPRKQNYGVQKAPS